MATYHLAGTEIGPMLIIKEGLQPDGAEFDREIPIQAIASFSEMLGYADPAEALEAIIADQDQRDEDNPIRDPFAEVQQLLTHREQAREAEAATAHREGTANDPRSPQLRSAFAAYRAVHQPVDGGECVMDRCRREARTRLNIAAPTKTAGAATRVSRASTTKTGSLAQVVAECADLIEAERKGWLHMLTGNRADPLTPEPEGSQPTNPLADLFAKYGGGDK